MSDERFLSASKKVTAIIKLGVITTMLLAVISLMWQSTEADATAVIIVTSTADTATTDDACTLREAIANANSDSDTTGGDCAGGLGADTIRFAPALSGQTISLDGAELVLSSTITIIGPGSGLLTISGSDTSRVISVTTGATAAIERLTIANGRVISASGGGVANAGALTLDHVTVANNTIAGGGITNGGGIYNAGALTVTHSAIISNTNSGDTAQGGGLGSTAGTVHLQHTTVSGNTSNTWGGGINNTDTSAMTITYATIAHNTAILFYGGGLLANNATDVTIGNTILAANEDNGSPTTGQSDCYHFSQAPTSMDNNIVEKKGNCSFSASGDVTGQDAYLAPLAANGGEITNESGAPVDPDGQTTLTHALLPTSPAIDRIATSNDDCTPATTTDQRGYYRHDACDSGAFEYDGVQIGLEASVNDDNPGPSDIITYTLVVHTAVSGDVSATNVVVTDVLPSGLNDIGPATAVSAGGPISADQPPTLISGETITQATAVTITLPVSVSIGIKGGTIITNTAFANSTDVNQPVYHSQTITVRNVPPVAVADTPTVREDSGTTTFAVQANDDDLNGDVLTTTLVGPADQQGTAVLNGNRIDYTPYEHFNGTELFTYTLSDGALTHTSLVSVTVTPVNDAPVIAGSDTITAEIDEDGTLAPFTFSATDVDGDTLAWQVANGVGTAVISNTGSPGGSSATITYTLGADFVGVDTVDVQAGDGILTDTVTISVTVNALNDAPRAADDAFFITTNKNDQSIMLDVLANDEEVDGQVLTVTAVTTPTLNGAVHISGTHLIYTPNLSLNQTDTFTYTVSDGSLSDTAVVSVTAVAGLDSAQRGEEITLANLGDSNDITLTLSIPTAVAPTDSQFSLIVSESTQTPDSQQPAGTQITAAPTPQAPDDHRSAGLDLTLKAYIDGLPAQPYTTTVPITLTITYSNDSFSHLLRGERDLALFNLTDGEWSSDGITLLDHDLSTNQLTASVSTLTEIALFGWNGIPVYLPTIIRP